MVQIVREVFGGDTSEGQLLTAFNFSYTEGKPDIKFRQLVNDVLNDKTANRWGRPTIESRSPITLSTYPLETGLSIYGPATDKLFQQFYRDNSKPNEIYYGELGSIVVLTCAVIFLFERALMEAIRM